MKKIATPLMCLLAMLPLPAAYARDHHDDRRHDARDHHRDHRHAERHDYRAERHERDRYDGRRHERRVAWREWRRGDRFDRRYARDYQRIDYRRYRSLRPPPRGYHYVRSGDDAILVAVATGIVAAVVVNAIR